VSCDKKEVLRNLRRKQIFAEGERRGEGTPTTGGQKSPLSHGGIMESFGMLGTTRRRRLLPPPDCE